MTRHDQQSTRPTTRRAVLGGAVAAAGSALALPGRPAAGSLGAATGTGAATATAVARSVPSTGTHLVTLGTSAGPAVRSSRNGIATALVVDGALYLVDCGLGVVRQVAEAGLRTDGLRAVFLTHLHSDHVAELPAMLLYHWGPQVGGFTTPVDVVGPGSAGSLPAGYHPTVAPPVPGTREHVEGLLRAHAYDINIRVNDEARPPLDDLVRARDIELPEHVGASARGELAPPMEPVEVYRDERVRVLAGLVHHPPVFPSYGFRIETPHGVVALSGDTTEHENTVRLARDADVLVHEAVYLPYYRDRGLPEDFIHHLAESHTEPAGAGRVARQAGVRHLVLSHLAGVAEDEEWAAPARAEYDGQVTVAADGQVFPIGASR